MAVRSSGAAALVVGALFFGVADLVRRVVLPDSAAAQADSLVAAVSAHQGLWLVAGFLALMGPALMLPGVLAVARAADGRGRTLTMAGGRLLAVGLLASVAHTIAFYGSVGVYPSAGLEPAAVATFEDATNRYPLLAFVIVVFIVGMMLGPILLTVGLRRGRRVAIWVPIAAVVFAVSGMVGGVATGVVGLVAVLATFAGVAASRPASTAGAVATLSAGLPQEPVASTHE